MTTLHYTKETRLVYSYTSEPVEATHYIIETNRLSYLFEPQLTFILQQLSLYFLQKGSCWFERDTCHKTTALHFLIPASIYRNDIQWTEAFDFKTYIEKMFSEPCMLCAGGACYV